MAGELEDRRQGKNSEEGKRGGLFRGLFRGPDPSEEGQDSGEPYDDSTKDYGRPGGLLQRMRDGRPVENALRGLAGDEFPFGSVENSPARDRLKNAAAKGTDGFELYNSDIDVAPKAEHAPALEYNQDLAKYLEDPTNDASNLYIANSGIYELELIGKNKKVADNLQSLNASGTSLTDAGLDKLAAKTQYPKLTSLNLAYNEITDVGASAFQNMPNLKELDLEQNSIADDALGYLPKNKLEKLKLDHTAVTSNGLENLAKNQTNLEMLSLNGVNLTVNVEDPRQDQKTLEAKAVAAISAMKNLKYLSLENTQLSPFTVQEIRKKLPAKCVLVGPDGTEF